MTLRPSIAAVLSILGLCGLARAQEVDGEKISQKLFAATVTVRVSGIEFGRDADPNKTAPADAPGKEKTPSQKIAVQSGVLLGQGLLVTFSQYPPSAQFKITLPDGGQAEAQVRVIDLYSGLSLLQIDTKKTAGLEPAESMPSVGAAILTAAASGLEKPAVSKGILGGVDRTLSGTHLPPLLQCDVRTTDTSSGAAVVDRQGRLVGIVAVTATADRNQWTYAVPVGHVQRLLRAKSDGKLVVLNQQRPMVGLTLVAGEKEGQVTVERVVAGGPAEKAGLRVNDEVLEVDGLKIRAVYQFQALVMKKQPGDRIELVMRRAGADSKVAVTLGGGAIVDPTDLILKDGQLLVRSLRIERPESRNLAAGEPQAADRDELTLLQTQVNRFATFIEKLRQDLRSRDEEIAKLKARIEALEKERKAQP